MRDVSRLILLFVIASAACACHAALDQPVILGTAGGSRIQGLLTLDGPMMFRTTAGREPLDMTRVKRITFGQRPDLNSENDARLALSDLGSENFLVRAKAEVRLRQLGAAATRSLRVGAISSDSHVASRSRCLLGEVTGRNAADLSADTVTFTDDKTVEGELGLTEITVRTRWGRLRLLCMSVEYLEPVKATDVDARALAAADAAPVNVPVTLGQVVSNPVTAIKWTEFMAEENERTAHLLKLTIDKIPDPQAPTGKGAKTIATKAGDALNEAYKSWGVLLQPADEKAALKAGEDAVNAKSKGLSGKTSGAGLDLRFIVPGTHKADAELRSGGVHELMAFFPNEEESHQIGLEVFDRAGRRIGQVFNLEIAHMRADSSFVGVRSAIPIARARFFRTNLEDKKELIFDDIHCSRVIAADRPMEQAALWLTTGERVSGALIEGGEAGLKLRPEFFEARQPPVAIPLADVDRYEPAWIANPEHAKQGSFTPHGFLLQNGEAFRGRLRKLDQKQVLLELAGGVEMTLPREVLRKIELKPKPIVPGELPEPISVGENEKPGVDLGEDKEKPDEKKDEGKKPKKKVEEPEVKIVSVDPIAREITIDDGGEWTIGYALARSLIFPKNPDVKAEAKFRGWLLTLREGSIFEVSLVAVTPESITANMSGGTVKFPAALVDSIQRRKP